jgi:hypothetical protein
MWFNIALAFGNEEARQQLRRISPLMSQGQIETALEMMDEFTRKLLAKQKR